MLHCCLQRLLIPRWYHITHVAMHYPFKGVVKVVNHINHRTGMLTTHLVIPNIGNCEFLRSKLKYCLIAYCMWSAYAVSIDSLPSVLSLRINKFFLALANSNYNLASAQSVPKLASLAAAILALGKWYQNQDHLPADKIFYVIELAKLTSANKKKTIEKKTKEWILI